jgi:hypothetical protein
MSGGITFDELLAWNQHSADNWKAHLDANPALLQLPCDIGGAANVQAFVRHIWAAELIWSQRLAGLPLTARENLPTGPLDALFDVHLQAVEIFRTLLAAPENTWSDPYVLNFDWLPPEERPSPGERSRLTCYSTVNAIGRNWPRWSAALGSPRSSGAICFLVLRCSRLRHRLRLRLLFLEARPAQYRPALRRLERNRGLRTALRTCRACLGANSLRAARTFRLALLAVLGIVLELFIVEKDLLARCKHKLGAAVYTLEDSIGEFHGRLPSQVLPPKSAMALQELAGPGSLSSFVLQCKGPGPHQKQRGIRTLTR